MANAFQAVLDKAKKQPTVEKTKRPARAAVAAQPKLVEAPVDQVVAPAVPRSKHYKPVREGKKFVGAHLPPEVARQLKMLAAEDDTTVQELLEQAIDLLFVKHGKAKAAELTK